MGGAASVDEAAGGGVGSAVAAEAGVDSKYDVDSIKRAASTTPTRVAADKGDV